MRALIDELTTVSVPNFAFYNIEYAEHGAFHPYLGQLRSYQSGVLPNGNSRLPEFEQNRTIGALIDQGALAVPALLECLADARPTATNAEPAMMSHPFVAQSVEMLSVPLVDWNDLTESWSVPMDLGVKALPILSHPNRLAVGDFCFFVLGQIVNRRFLPLEVPTSTSLEVHSPVQFTEVRNLVRMHYAGFTRELHRTQLVRDFVDADREGRQMGAILRLSFYFPEELPKLVKEFLHRPHCPDDCGAHPPSSPGCIRSHDIIRVVTLLRFDRFAELDRTILETMTTTENAEVALACMPRLLEHGYGKEVSRMAQGMLDCWGKDLREDDPRLVELRKMARTGAGGGAGGGGASGQPE